MRSSLQVAPSILLWRTPHSKSSLMALYPGKPVRLLMRDEMVRGLAIKPGEVFSKDQAVSWFTEHYPRIKEATIGAHLIRFSTNARSRVHYSAKPGEDDVFFQIDGSHFRLYDPAHDPPPIRPGDDEQPPEPPPPPEGSEFAYEQDLRNYLARHLDRIEPGLRLYRDEEGITGVEFPAGGRFIDILAVDRKGDYVVIELKVSKGYDRVVGQLLRYIGWIEAHHAEPDRKVRGVIIAKGISEDLRLACGRLADISLYEYDLSVTLRSVGRLTTPADV